MSKELNHEEILKKIAAMEEAEAKEAQERFPKHFDERGNLKQHGDKVDFLFNQGFATDAARVAVRRYIMEISEMPGAHTDLARLFYSMVAQETYGVPAAKMFQI